MPIHDWTRVDAGLFHHFHQGWTVAICNAFNRGLLPSECYALIDGDSRLEQLALPRRRDPAVHSSGSVAVAEAPPRARFVTSVETDLYASMANHIVIKHRHGQVVAVIEIVSPGNKSGGHALRSFVEKTYELLRAGIHLLVVDLFPPSPRDPQGIHKAIWDEMVDEPFELPSDKPLTVAAYFAGEPKTAYVEPVSIGDRLPDLPIFLDNGTYIPAPLERTYQAAWEACPDVIRELVEGRGSKEGT